MYIWYGNAAGSPGGAGYSNDGGGVKRGWGVQPEPYYLIPVRGQSMRRDEGSGCTMGSYVLYKITYLVILYVIWSCHISK